MQRMMFGTAPAEEASVKEARVERRNAGFILIATDSQLGLDPRAKGRWWEAKIVPPRVSPQERSGPLRKWGAKMRK